MRISFCSYDFSHWMNYPAACPPLVGLPAFGGLARLWWACPPWVGLPALGGIPFSQTPTIG